MSAVFKFERHVDSPQTRQQHNKFNVKCRSFVSVWDATIYHSAIARLGLSWCFCSPYITIGAVGTTGEEIVSESIVTFTAEFCCFCVPFAICAIIRCCTSSCTSSSFLPSLHAFDWAVVSTRIRGSSRTFHDLEMEFSNFRSACFHSSVAGWFVLIACRICFTNGLVLFLCEHAFCALFTLLLVPTTAVGSGGRNPIVIQFVCMHIFHSYWRQVLSHFQYLSTLLFSVSQPKMATEPPPAASLAAVKTQRPRFGTLMDIDDVVNSLKLTQIYDYLRIQKNKVRWWSLPVTYTCVPAVVWSQTSNNFSSLTLIPAVVTSFLGVASVP